MRGAALTRESPERDRLRGALLVAGAGFVFSFGALAFRAVEAASEWQYLVYRGGSVAVAMMGLLWVRHGRQAVTRVRTAGWRQHLAGVVLGGLFTLFISSIARTTVAIALFMQAAAPFTAALLAWLFLRERVRRVTWMAMAVAVVGIAVMVGGRPDTGSATGVILAGGIPIGLGIYSVLLRSADDVEPAVPALVAGVVAAVAAILVAGVDASLSMSLRDMILAVVGGGVLLGMGLPMFNAGHRAVPAAEVNILLLVEVILGPMWVWIWPGETPAATTIIGGGVVLAAVIGMTVAAEPRRSGSSALPIA